MFSNITKFTELDADQKKYFFEAYITLGIMRFAILVIPFKRLVARLEHSQHQKEHTAPGDDKKVTAERIGKVVAQAANNTPWESACLVQALTAQKMLSRRNIPGIFYLGLIKESDIEEPLKAHAWLRCDDRVITGESGHERFTVISTFSWK